MTTTFGTSTNNSKKMAKVQCLSLVDLSNIGNLNTLRQTMELRTQVTITGGPKRITDSHQLIYDPAGTQKYRDEMNQYAQWLNENQTFRDKIINDYLKDDYNLWYKHKQF